VLDNIRSEIWLKLWGNLTFNPVSALSRATLVDICQYPLTRELAAAMMAEAQEVAGKLGITFRVSIDKRIAGAEKVGKHKTSMLQDVEAGRRWRSTRWSARWSSWPADEDADAAHRCLRRLPWASRAASARSPMSFVSTQKRCCELPVLGLSCR
jgi:hypothetical protein